MTTPLRILRDPVEEAQHLAAEPREWLIANGMGGYASGPVGSALTRRFHGLLVAALPPPHGRTMMLTLLVERIRTIDGTVIGLGAQPDPGGATDAARATFRLELGLPVWRFESRGLVIERRVVMVHGNNTTAIIWRLLDGADRVDIAIRPYLQIRPHDGPLDAAGSGYAAAAVQDTRWEITGNRGLPPLRLAICGARASLQPDGGSWQQLCCAVEARRGYDDRGALWSPGACTAVLPRGSEAALIASAEPWDSLRDADPDGLWRRDVARRRALIAQAAPALQESPADELVLAADSFIIAPPRDKPRHDHSRRGPDRTVIAGYHWFTDWGRDTMISLEGLTLLTGRHDAARSILETFADSIRCGLIPNYFSEHDGKHLYNTADATLWFFHALERYVVATGDRRMLRRMLPKLLDIVRHHRAGTCFGIAVDPQDGLLRQGAAGYQLTWMDAKVGDWVVTPRHGKAVEINALWYNALCLLARWLREEDVAPEELPLDEMAAQVRTAFNQRFWFADGGYLYDVVDGVIGDDPSCRPNQLFAFCLRYPVLDAGRWAQVLDVVSAKLLTPVGLRSLSPDHPHYQPRYDGDLHARDAAYHQGTIWAWLIGPFVDAWIRVHPQRQRHARRFLDGFTAHLDAAGVGSISEVFDAEPPFVARGCISQAWSVAEFLRVWHRTAG